MNWAFFSVCGKLPESELIKWFLCYAPQLSRVSSLFLSILSPLGAHSRGGCQWPRHPLFTDLALVVKNLPAVGSVETGVWSLGWKGPLEKGWPPTPVLSPWTEEPGRLRSLRLQRVRHNWGDSMHTHGRWHSSCTVVRDLTSAGQ